MVEFGKKTSYGLHYSIIQNIIAMWVCRRVNAREKAEQARAAARKAADSAQRARSVSEHFSWSPTATSLTSSSQQLGQYCTIDNHINHRCLRQSLKLTRNLS